MITFDTMFKDTMRIAGERDSNELWATVVKFEIAETLANTVRDPEHKAMQREARLALKATWEANFA